MKKYIITTLVVLLVQLFIIGAFYVALDPAPDDTALIGQIEIATKFLILGTLTLFGYIAWRQCFKLPADLPNSFWLPLGACLTTMVGIDLLNDIIDIKSTMPNSFGGSPTWWSILATSLVGPVAEELCFREALTGTLLRKGASPLAAIAVGAVTFSLMHFTPSVFIPTFVVGVVFGIIFWKTGSIIIPTIAHVVHNSTNRVLLHIYDGDAHAASNQMIIGEGAPSYVALVILTALSIYLMTRFYKLTPTHSHSTL